MEWRAWFTAPKDGSKIIAIDDDLSGVALMLWGESHEGKAGWLGNDGEFHGPDEAMAGWIPAPADTPDFPGWK